MNIVFNIGKRSIVEGNFHVQNYFSKLYQRGETGDRLMRPISLFHHGLRLGLNSHVIPSLVLSSLITALRMSLSLSEYIFLGRPRRVINRSGIPQFTCSLELLTTSTRLVLNCRHRQPYRLYPPATSLFVS